MTVLWRLPFASTSVNFLPLPFLHGVCPLCPISPHCSPFQYPPPPLHPSPPYPFPSSLTFPWLPSPAGASYLPQVTSTSLITIPLARPSLQHPQGHVWDLRALGRGPSRGSEGENVREDRGEKVTGLGRGLVAMLGKIN